jgi:hypothetical protein
MSNWRIEGHHPERGWEDTGGKFNGITWEDACRRCSELKRGIKWTKFRIGITS